MQPQKKKLVLAVFAALFSTCLIAPDLLAQSSNLKGLFMWEVQGPDSGRAFILGSIHMADQRLYPLDERILEAYQQSGALVVELNSEAISQDKITQYIVSKGMAFDQPPLPERLSPKTREALLSCKYHSPLNNMFKPWLAALVISQQALVGLGVSTDYGLDKYFLDKAKADGLPVLELETFEEQMSVMADMTDDEADLFLWVTIDELKDLPQTIGLFITHWKTGDDKAFASIFFKEYDKYPELAPFRDRLITFRNRLMADRLEAMLKQRKDALFVVVGAGHLLGEESIQNILAGRGYAVVKQ